MKAQDMFTRIIQQWYWSLIYLIEWRDIPRRTAAPVERLELPRMSNNENAEEEKKSSKRKKDISLARKKKKTEEKMRERPTT